VEPPTPEPVDVGAYAALIGLVRTGRLEVACPLLDAHLRRHPLHVEAHLLAAQIAAELSDPETALRCARRAAFLAPDAAFPSFLLADAQRGAGRPAAAERTLRHVVSLVAKRGDDAPLPYAGGLTARQLKDVLDVD